MLSKLYRSKLEYIMTEEQLQRLIDNQDYLEGDTLEEKTKTLIEHSRRNKAREYFEVVEISIEPLTKEEEDFCRKQKLVKIK